MRKRVFWSILLVSMLTLIVTAVLIILVLYNDFTNEQKRELVTEAVYVSNALDESDVSYLREIGRNSVNRITLISSNGTVLYDNYADAAELENHLDRPEVSSALKNGTGEATRLSDTLGQRTYYYALRLENGNILRISVTTKSIFGVVAHTVIVILFIVFLAVLISVIAARIFTKTIISPINKLNLDNPLVNNTYDELSPLLVRMEKQNKKIAEQFEEINAKQNELNTITEIMNEALVIYSENKHVLFANKSALKLFEAADAKGLGYLELSREIGYIRSVESAFGGKSAGEKLYKNGRVYQLSVNPVVRGEIFAAVLFAVDITEKEQSDKMRREFSANVSHELKTPLTSIMGYAEIMQNGIAKQEDYPHFAGQIFTESKRLLTLIDDIIKLSRLDEESMKNEFVPVDLYDQSEKVIRALKNKAELSGVSLALDGQHASVRGIEGVIHEIIFNLCDNAITYNKKGGSVSVRVVRENDKIVLEVTDTGIGISPEHQTRIFERFYRVDKSRSKDTGGTGLGLSIVKHGAMLHEAEIELDSAVGKGTSVKLIFNKQ